MLREPLGLKAELPPHECGGSRHAIWTSPIYFQQLPFKIKLIEEVNLDTFDPASYRNETFRKFTTD